MNRSAIRLLAATALLAVACTDPTAVCACTIPPAVAFVRGQVIDAADAPVAGAQVAFDGVPANRSVEPSFALNQPAVTDAEGRFVTMAIARFGEGGELTLRALVVRAGTTDTVRMRTGTTARFGGSAGTDTVDVTLKLP